MQNSDIPSYLTIIQLYTAIYLKQYRAKMRVTIKNKQNTNFFRARLYDTVDFKNFTYRYHQPAVCDLPNTLKLYINKK